MPEIRFDTYYRHDDLTRLLHAYAEEYPSLVRVESIGTSYEGRDIWVVTVTQQATGDHAEKPAFWVDGNIHALEVSASTACLYLLHTLVTNYGTDDEITRCLDTRAFYICPRVGPDGAERALSDRPRVLRSSTRPYPYDEDPLGGLAMEDIDGDGRLLTMRIPDPDGAWKVSVEDPRLMVRREPAEAGGQYYRLLPEGPVEDYDGALITLQPFKEGLDLNRNFPMGWKQEYEQRGAGLYPTSEPEVQAQVQFLATHANITGGVSFHTYSGVLLRPYTDRADDVFPVEDLRTYQKLGQKGTELTGYPAISIYHDFRYHPKKFIQGGSDAFFYEQMGRFYWAVELWSPWRQAGIKEIKYIDWWREHPIEDDLALLKWSDEVLEGKGYVEWYPFEHPQLGRVELGGWDVAHVFRNPPAALLEKEVAVFPKWLVWSLLISPCLRLVEATAQPLGEDAYRVRLVVQNTGWLPTYITKQALEKKLVRGLVCEIGLPDGAHLAVGKAREELGQMEGRAYKGSASIGWDTDTTEDRLKVEWVVMAPQGGVVSLLTRHERAGVVRAQVSLGGEDMGG